MSLSTEEFPYENTNYAAHEYACEPFQNFFYLVDRVAEKPAVSRWKYQIDNESEHQSHVKDSNNPYTAFNQRLEIFLNLTVVVSSCFTDIELSTSVYSLTRGSDSDSSGGEASVNSTEELSSFEDFILEIIPDQTVQYGLTPFSIISSAPGRALFMCEGN